jgi:hypothetical protein
MKWMRQNRTNPHTRRYGHRLAAGENIPTRTHTCGAHSRKPVDKFTLVEADGSGETGELFWWHYRIFLVVQVGVGDITQWWRAVCTKRMFRLRRSSRRRVAGLNNTSQHDKLLSQQPPCMLGRLVCSYRTMSSGSLSNWFRPFQLDSMSGKPGSMIACTPVQARVRSVLHTTPVQAQVRSVLHTPPVQARARSVLHTTPVQAWVRSVLQAPLQVWACSLGLCAPALHTPALHTPFIKGWQNNWSKMSIG